MAASFAAAALYAGFAALYLAAPNGFSTLLHALAPGANTQPFGDLEAMLQAGICWRQGVNVYVHNACMGGGIYNYSPLLLDGAYLKIGPQAHMAGGILLGMLFIAGLAGLPMPRCRRELSWRVLAVCSCPVIWALEQSNFDIVMFLLVLCGLRLLRIRWYRSMLGYLLILIAAACKFYPVIVLALGLRERLRALFALGLLGGLGAVMFAVHFAAGTASALQILPSGPPFTYVFGAMNVPFGLVLLCFMPALTVAPTASQFLAAVHHPDAPAVLQLGTSGLTMAALGAAALTWKRYEPALRGIDPQRGFLLLGGAMIIAFCFFAAQNLNYRCIFFLLTLPGLWWMATRAPSHRGQMGALLGSVLILLWEPLLRGACGLLAEATLGKTAAAYPEVTFWCLRELVWWWVVIQFTAMSLCFVVVSVRQLQAEWQTGQREPFFNGSEPAA